MDCVQGGWLWGSGDSGVVSVWDTLADSWKRVKPLSPVRWRLCVFAELDVSFKRGVTSLTLERQSGLPSVRSGAGFLVGSDANGTATMFMLGGVASGTNLMDVWMLRGDSVEGRLLYPTPLCMCGAPLSSTGLLLMGRPSGVALPACAGPSHCAWSLHVLGLGCFHPTWGDSGKIWTCHGEVVLLAQGIASLWRRVHCNRACHCAFHGEKPLWRDGTGRASHRQCWLCAFSVVNCPGWSGQALGLATQCDRLGCRPHRNPAAACSFMSSTPHPPHFSSKVLCTCGMARCALHHR